MNSLSKIEASAAACQAGSIEHLSFVIPAFNEEENITRTVSEVAKHTQDLVMRYDIVIVDDGSRDATFETAKTLAQAYPIIALRLSRNFGKEQAIMSGLRRAQGDAVVILDADLQEPLRYLKDMIDHYADGFDMVYAVRANRSDEPAIKRLTTWVFYHMLGQNEGFTIPRDARDFRLMDRRVVDALTSTTEKNLFMKGLFGWVGFKSKALPIDMLRRTAGRSNFGFKNLFRLGCTAITAFSTWPLRVWTVIGGALAMCSIGYGIWLFLRTLVWGTDLPGWSTLAVAIFLLGGIQLFSVGILGEYLARVFAEVKGRPGYLIAEEHCFETDECPA